MRQPAVTVTPFDSLSMAAQHMQQHHLSHLPVVQQDRLVGMVSLRAVHAASPSPATTLSVYEMHGYMQQLPVATIMTPAVVTVTPRLPLVAALRLMQDHGMFTLPVVYLGDVIGLLNACDLLPLCGTRLGTPRPRRFTSASSSSTAPQLWEE